MNIDYLGNCLINLKNDYEPCPGKYCARLILNTTTCLFSECQKCPRGYRSFKNLDVCLKCTNQPKLYDYMYLAFMLNITVILHYYFIDKSFSNIKKKKNNLNLYRILFIYILPLIECILSLLISILIYPPLGSLKLESCQIDDLFDWYSVFFNPNLDYTNKLNCTQEIVYPFYSIVMVFYFLTLITMILIRFIAKKIFLNKNRIYVDYLNKSTFAALYFIPFLFLIHTIAGGIIYYSYPVLTGVVFIISNNYHLANAFKKDFFTVNSCIGNIKNALKLLKETRNIFIQLIHFYFYIFSIVSYTELKSLYDLFYLILVPAPLAFFLISYKHSSPKRFQNY